MRGAVHAVGNGDHGFQFKARAHIAIGQQDLDHRHRIGEPGHLDQYDVEITRATNGALGVQVEQTGSDLLMHVAAQAAGIEDAHAGARRLDQHMIDAHLAVFVDDDGRAREGTRLQQTIEQGGFAAAKKAGDQQHRQARRLRLERGQGHPPITLALMTAASVVVSVERQLNRSRIF